MITTYYIPTRTRMENHTKQYARLWALALAAWFLGNYLAGTYAEASTSKVLTAYTAALFGGVGVLFLVGKFAGKS